MEILFKNRISYLKILETQLKTLSQFSLKEEIQEDLTILIHSNLQHILIVRMILIMLQV